MRMSSLRPFMRSRCRWRRPEHLRELPPLRGESAAGTPALPRQGQHVPRLHPPLPRRHHGQHQHHGLPARRVPRRRLRVPAVCRHPGWYCVLRPGYIRLLLVKYFHPQWWQRVQPLLPQGRPQSREHQLLLRRQLVLRQLQDQLLFSPPRPGTLKL